MEDLSIDFNNLDLSKTSTTIKEGSIEEVENQVNQQGQGQGSADSTDFKPADNPAAVVPDNNKDKEGEQGESDKDEVTPNDDNTTDDKPLSADEEAQLLLTGDTSTLDAETIEVKEKLFNIYGASGYDMGGNLIDSTGKVVFTYSDLVNFIKTDKLPTNNEGQLVNAHGEVLENVSVSTQADDINSVIQEQYGFTLSNIEEINSIEDPEEQRKMALVSLVKESAVIAQRQFLENNPVLADIYNHLKLGGNLEDYKSATVDYSKVDVTKLGVEDKLRMIKTLYDKKGLPFNDSIVNLLRKDEQTLNNTTTDAVKALASLTKEESTVRAKQIQEQEQAEAKAIQEHWDTTRSIIDKGMLDEGIAIPEKDKQGFFDYLAKPVKDGLSQDMIDEDNITLERRLLLSYLRYKNADLLGFRNRVDNTNKTKERMNALRNVKVTTNSQKNPFRNDDFDVKSLSLDNIKLQ